MGYGAVLLAADNRYRLAREYLHGDAHGDPTAAVRRASALDPLEVLYRKDLALQLLTNGSAGQQLDALNSALALEPEDVHVLVLKAQLLSGMGKQADAARIVQEVVRLAPTDPLVTRAANALSSQP